MTEKRRCRVGENYGNFACYGSQPCYDDSNHMIGMQTLAVVELDDGRVVEVEPHKVVFPPAKPPQE